jgi:hypothetical protein
MDIAQCDRKYYDYDSPYRYCVDRNSNGPAQSVRSHNDSQRCGPKILYSTLSTSETDPVKRSRRYGSRAINCSELEGSPEDGSTDGETPAIEVVLELSSFCCEPLLSLRMVSAIFSPTLARGAPSFPLPRCTCVAYSSSWRKNPVLGLTIPRLARTAVSASLGVILIVAMRYAHTTVALRLMPMRQWT